MGDAKSPIGRFVDPRADADPRGDIMEELKKDGKGDAKSPIFGRFVDPRADRKLLQPRSRFDEDPSYNTTKPIMAIPQNNPPSILQSRNTYLGIKAEKKQPSCQSLGKDPKGSSRFSEQQQAT